MEARLTPRRLLCAATIVALVSAMSACGGGGDAQAAAKDPPLQKYSAPGLSFSYPTAWTASKAILPADTLHFQPLAYVSTQPVGPPCTTHGNETACGFPLKRLRPGGVLVMWQYPYALPGFTLGGGARIKVDAHPATRTTTKPGVCRQVGADRTIDVLIQLVPHSSYVELTACLRGPNLVQAERSVDAMLASATFPSYARS
ncbi:MAG TPA: hypothetical protein VGF72_10330 [Gaiellaceae bacterium]